jgi:hypothetical protein
MEALLGILKSAAPMLATAVAGPMGGAAVSFIADKLGVENKTIEGVTTALAGNPEALEKLKQMDLEFAKLDQQDRDSARKRELEMSKADVWGITKNITTILSLGVIMLSFILFAILIFIDVKPAAKDILIYILGVLSAAVTQILAYYFGSSQGSKDKTREIQEMLKK